MKTTRARKPSAGEAWQEEKRQEDGRPQLSSRVAAILNAAECVFGTHGYAGTSMRQISEDAGVAQALLHYHYASKDRLYEAVFERRSSAINEHRGQLLEALFAGETPATVEDVLTIAFMPLSEVFRGEDAENLALYVQMVAAISLGSDERSRRLRKQYYDPISERVIDAIQTVLPAISREDAVWAYLFSAGSRQQAHALNGRAERLGASARTPKSRSHYSALVRFAAAGIREMIADDQATSAANPKAITRHTSSIEMDRYRFNVFGNILSIERQDERWRCFAIGTDGKRSPANLAIPPEITRDELAQYLFDIYHETAAWSDSDVFEINRTE